MLVVDVEIKARPAGGWMRQGKAHGRRRRRALASENRGFARVRQRARHAGGDRW